MVLQLIPEVCTHYEQENLPLENSLLVLAWEGMVVANIINWKQRMHVAMQINTTNDDGKCTVSVSVSEAIA